MTDLLPSYLAKRFFLLAILPTVFFVLPSFKYSAKVSSRPGRAEAAAELQLRENAVEYAKEFVGLKYHYAGTTPTTGFDCSGFTSYVLKSVDVRVSPGSATQAAQGDKIPLDDVMPGDLVFFGSRGRISHVAMVVERKSDGIYCVHSTCSRGVVVENISTSKYWKPKIRYARDVISKQNPF
jgi:cell wall-associated NlpC family hydrolase